MKFRMLAVAAAMALSAGAHASSVVFSDDFDSDTPGLNTVPSLQGWTITNGGTVDVIPEGGQFNFLGSGEFVDLDGSTGKSGELTNSISVAPGWYSMTFELAGNHRDTNPDTVTVTLGGTSVQDTPVSETSTDYYTVTGYTSTGSLTFSFLDSSSDNIGALLDNVTISAVPEPGNLALMLAGFAALGVVARRRRS